MQTRNIDVWISHLKPRNGTGERFASQCKSIDFGRAIDSGEALQMAH
jgi:hypothetical protein